METLRRIAADLAAGRRTSRELVEGCLDRIGAADGEGTRAFIKVHAERARLTADWIDRQRKQGFSLPRWAGIPVSIKDLFDEAGETTKAGSVALANAPPAEKDAAAVARLRSAGFIPIGRTNMTEFAFSAIGMNPHYGTPAGVWDRRNRRIPGGSSSGAAISVADAMAPVAIGSDTGGSCRIPAALNGIVGFKPTAARVPRDGVLPLSQTLDSVGPIAASADCASIIDSILAGETSTELTPRPLRGLRFAIPQTLVLDDLEAPASTAFARALAAISRSGGILVDIRFAELAELRAINAKGGFAAAEAYAWHRTMIAANADQYDPQVLKRILRGREQSAADYLDLLAARRDFIDRARRILVDFDAALMPTVPIVAPRIADLASDDAFTSTNLQLLRNPSVANFLNACAISIPCHRHDEPPVGITVQGIADDDRNILAIAASIEKIVSPQSI